MHYLIKSLILLLLVTHNGAFAERLAASLEDQANIKVSKNGAQTLNSIKKFTVSDDYHWESSEYFSIRINDLQAARDYGRITINYNHFYSELELEYANVLTPDGEIKPLKADAMQKRTSGGQDFYEDGTMLVFSLPEITPGSIMEFQYRRKSVKLAMPGIFNTSLQAFWYQPTIGGNGGRVDPVHSASFEISVPANMPLHSKMVGPFKPSYQKQYKQQQVVHQWQWRDLPELAIESSMPTIDTVMSRVRVSTSKHWADVDQWTWALAKEKFSQSPTIKDLAKTLAPMDASKTEKIKAVYAYIQKNIRYVFAHLGRGGYEPHFADEVIQQRYGDCKDQTILAIALLRELGIEAFPSLVITLRNGKPDMELVALYFDHMIVWIPGDGDGMWMDTTADRALFPGLSNYLLDQPALIINGKGGKLTSIGSQLDDNVGSLDMNYYIDSNNHLIVDVITEVSGIFEQNLRNWWINDNNRETSLQQMMATVFPEAKSQAEVSHKVLNAENLWQALKIESRFDFGLAREKPEYPVSYGVSVIQVYRLFGDFNSLQIPRERKQRWVNIQPVNYKITARMSGANNDLAAVLNNGIDYKNDYYTVKQSGGKAGTHYEVNVSMHQNALDLSVEEYDRYYQSLTTMNKAGFWSVSFSRDKKQQQLADVLLNNDSSDLQSQLALARYYLEQGEFEKALEPATIAAGINQSDGETWYVLGLVQGYNAMIEESMDSFTKASNLGYSHE